jgi:hypothetical protein
VRIHVRTLLKGDLNDLTQLEPFEPFLPSVQSALDGRYKCNRIAERNKSVLEHTQIVALRFPRQSLKYRLRPALKPLLTFLSAKRVISSAPTTRATDVPH